ncbi:flavodoxin family protein [Nocardioides soli]|uniref:Flavodoxin-like domain-containing protein n=1 Tax=Nocardioides soli TaxID=1036020 RepID=A0A7W4VXV9_9ACTN|nr:flavodoxin domain-containing protein [Nocardioides soli]MBB3043750.1 hypothetical protein [Nocardioides soli]
MTSIESASAVRAAVVYESMFGCTEEIARSVARGLEDAGATVTLRNVGEASAEEIPPFDLLVVGAPTHAFSLSRPSTRHDAVRQGARPAAELVGLRDWIAALGRRQPADGRPFAAFDTRVSRVRHLPKAAATRAAHLLARQGYRSIAHPMAFVVDDLRGPVAEGEPERARRWAQGICRAVAVPKAAAG